MKKKNETHITASPSLSGDVLSVSCPSVSEWAGVAGHREVTPRDREKDGGEREKLCSTEVLRDGWDTGNCTQMHTNQTHLLMYFCKQRGFARGWKGCVEKGNALSQCHAYRAFQPAIARESRSALFHHGFKSTLQSQGWSSIFSDTEPPGAFPCLGLIRRKVHTLYEWQPRALNLVQGRGRIQQVNTLDSFNLPLVFLPPHPPTPSESVVEGVKC